MRYIFLVYTEYALPWSLLHDIIIIRSFISGNNTKNNRFLNNKRNIVRLKSHTISLYWA